MNPNLSARGWPAHKHLLALAIPMILANSTTPLLGLVDTAVMGHMPSQAHLAGASIGALILTQLYWLCGFLRMSTTGLSAQARGKAQRGTDERAKVFYQASFMALLLGILVWVCQWPLLQLGLYLTSVQPQVAENVSAYFNVRVYGAPAAMLNLALIGYLVGQQRTRSVLWIQIVGNALNALLDIVFVLGLDWGVAGVAGASVIAEYTMAFCALYVALKELQGVKIEWSWFGKSARKLLLKLNSDMLLRNLALQACLAFLTIQGARYGQTAAAVNAILMQFFVLIALGLDGVAYAVEALCGEALGAKKLDVLRRQVRRGLMWSSLVAILYAIGFYLFGQDIILLLTDIPALQQAAWAYLPLMVWLPLLGHWCFLYDGVFVGITRSASMRNTMFVSALGVFFPVWYLLQAQGNVALWYALLAFLFARGVTLGVSYWRLSVKNFV